MKISKVRKPFPRPKAAAVIEQAHRIESPAATTFEIGEQPVMMECGYGVVIHDPDKNEFLDFVTGCGVLNTGHGHPRVVEAVKKQAQKLSHLVGAVNPTRTDLFGALTKSPPSMALSVSYLAPARVSPLKWLSGSSGITEISTRSLPSMVHTILGAWLLFLFVSSGLTVSSSLLSMWG